MSARGPRLESGVGNFFLIIVTLIKFYSGWSLGVAVPGICLCMYFGPIMHVGIACDAFTVIFFHLVCLSLEKILYMILLMHV